jgi:protein ImuB
VGLVPRFACLVVPRFAVTALRRAAPELRGCPIVVCQARGRDGESEKIELNAPLVDVSAEAARIGVRSGQSVTQALALSADLIVRPLDGEALASAQAALLEVASSVSPRVEMEEIRQGGAALCGAVYLDADGLERLFGSAAGIAAALQHRALRLGFEAGVALADRKATARIAAGLAARRGEAILVPPGGDAAWLAPLPLAALAPVAEPSCGEAASRRAARKANGGAARAQSWAALFACLTELGLRRIEDLARLPRHGLASRFGPAATRVWRIASGLDDAALLPLPPPFEVIEGTSLEYGVTSLEALLFLVRGLLDRATARLRLHGLACRGLTVGLGLDDGAWVVREVGVLAPTLDVKSLLLLTRATIEAAPPPAAIEAIRVTAIPDRARPDQLDLFRAPGPAPERLATTLARLAALCGPGMVGQPVAPPGHRPEAFRVAPFAASAGRRRAAEAAPTDELRSRLALRALRPPLAAEVFLERGEIAYVRADGLAGRAVVVSGPWRIETEWWSGPPCRRDYYDVQLSSGGVVRLYRDLAPADARQPEWRIDALYD